MRQAFGIIVAIAVLFGISVLSLVVQRMNAINSEPEWGSYTPIIYKDGLGIFEGETLTLRYHASLEEIMPKLMETKFFARYPFERSDYPDGSIELHGELYVQFGKFGGKFKGLQLDTDMRLAAEDRDEISQTLHVVQNDNEYPYTDYKTADSYAAAYEGVHNIYIFVNGKLELEGNAPFDWNQLARKAPVFEMNLLNIPVDFVEDNIQSKPTRLSYDGEILIMSRGLICFVDRIDLERDAKGRYKLTAQSQADAFKAYESQKITKTHQMNYFYLKPFHKT